MKNVVYVLLGFLIISGCVSQKKYDQLKYEELLCKDQNEKGAIERGELMEKINNLDSANNLLKSEISDLKNKIKALQDKEKNLQKQNQDLTLSRELLQKGSKDEIDKLMKMLSDKERRLEELENELNQRKAELERKNRDLIALQQAMARKDSITQALRKKVQDALLPFEGQGLKIHMKEGKVYVSLDEQLLFASGSAEIGKRGQDAITNLGNVLAQNPDINILIEGHTDDIPYRGTGQLLDNWDLSVKRATSVVRILTKNPSIATNRIVAAGRADSSPLETAKTAEARKINRRIEVILTPKLEELLQLLDQ